MLAVEIIELFIILNIAAGQRRRWTLSDRMGDITKRLRTYTYLNSESQATPKYIYCTYAPLYLCASVPMYLCTIVPMCQHTNVPVHQCTYVSVYKCTCAPMYLCTSVPMYLCIDFVALKKLIQLMK